MQDSNLLVLYLRDINLPKPDKYSTTQVIAFLQQLLTYKGFYDGKLEFIGATTLRCCPLSAQVKLRILAAALVQWFCDGKLEATISARTCWCHGDVAAPGNLHPPQ